MATKKGYLKDSIAKADGYFTAKGEKLKGAKLTQEQQDAWNGVVKKEAPKKAKKVKEEVEVEVSEDE